MAKAINLAVRVLVAVALGAWLFRWAGFSLVLPIVGVVYGFILFLLFGLPLVKKAGQSASLLSWPDDKHFRIMPEYSVAEARANAGKYQEAIDEYRKVIADHPDYVYPHVRIADLALTHLKDAKLAELELLSAVAKAQGEDTTAIATGRLADLYQFTLQQPHRALETMEQLRVKLPGTKAAALAEERIRALRELVAGRVPSKTPTKIAHRTTDEETLRSRRGF
jgi:tetratricopeptide (TPR) repeat protein